MRNNTGKPVKGFEVTAVGRDADGGLVATAISSGFNEPQILAPGGIGIASVYAGPEELPGVASWEYTVQVNTGAKLPVTVAGGCGQ